MTRALADITRMVGVVTPHTGFPTVDQMHAFTQEVKHEHAAVADVDVIGNSRGGDPIHSISIGNGSRHAVVIGNVHPNEPIGLLTIQHLVVQLCTDAGLVKELDTTWHFVPCVDPDGTRLNEGWYGGPLTRSNVARNFYRPPHEEQPEWTFPVEVAGRVIGEPLPETRAIMELIDQTHPSLVSSLHNADFGGAFYYVSGGDEEYWAGLTGLLDLAGIPLAGGLPDMPGARRLAEAVYQRSTFDEFYDAMAAGSPDAEPTLSGGSPADYAAKYGAADLVLELPIWTDPRGIDHTPGTRSLAELLRAAADDYRRSAELLWGVLDSVRGQVPRDSPFYRALSRSIRGNAQIFDAKAAGAETGEDRVATRAEEFMEVSWPEVMKLRAGGMVLRLLDEAAAAGAGRAVERERDALVLEFDSWCDQVERERPGSLVPLDKLVNAQAGSLLLAATRLRDGRPV